MKSIVILISGRGSNMEALLDRVSSGELKVRVAAVLSNRPQAKGLEIAAARDIPVRAIDHKLFPQRTDFDAALIKVIDEYAPDLVVLAGFMRVLSEDFVNQYAGRLLNIHPSLLPSFPGLHTHQRALEAGVRIHGCTVHFVTATLDHGPVVIQAAVSVLDGDTEESLAARVLAEEHKIYSEAVRWFVEGRLQLNHGRVVLDGQQEAGRALIAPQVRCE